MIYNCEPLKDKKENKKEDFVKQERREIERQVITKGRKKERS